MCTDVAIDRASLIASSVKRLQNIAASHGVELMFAQEPGLHWREILFIQENRIIRVDNDRGIDHLQGRPTGVPEIERARKFKLQAFACALGFDQVKPTLDQIYPRHWSADVFTHDEALKLANGLTLAKLRRKIGRSVPCGLVSPIRRLSTRGRCARCGKNPCTSPLFAWPRV